MPYEAHGALRFFRVLISVFVSMFAAAMLASAFWYDIDGHVTHRAAAPMFLMLFGFLIVAAVVCVLTAILFAIDRAQARRRRLANWQETRSRLAAAYWPIGSLTGAFLGFLWPIAGAFFIFLFLYWLMTGRLDGGPGWSIRNFRTTRWDEKVSLVLVTVLLLTWIKSIAVWAIAAALPVSLGTPEYAVQFERQMDGQMKAALRRFPDSQSCLVKDAEANHRPDLLKMDWDRIDTSAEMKVCTFRLLHAWGRAEDAKEWLQAQGFAVRHDLYENFDGTLRATGGWSVREKGPRYPTRGPIRRALRALPYAMSVTATYSADGSRLLHVNSSSSTL